MHYFFFILLCEHFPRTTMTVKKDRKTIGTQFDRVQSYSLMFNRQKRIDNHRRKSTICSL